MAPRRMVYTAIVKGTHLGQVWLARYNYQADNVTNSTNNNTCNLIRLNIDRAYQQLRATLHASWTALTIEISGEDGNSFWASNFVHAGSYGAAGSSLPPHIVYTYKFNRPDGEMRHGWKRHSGVNEGVLEDGLVTITGTFATQSAAYVTELILGTASDPESGISHFCQVKTQVNYQDLPREQWLVKNFTSGALQPYVGTQNTRKGVR